jgi:hypothetical protein
MASTWVMECPRFDKREKVVELEKNDPARKGVANQGRTV